MIFSSISSVHYPNHKDWRATFPEGKSDCSIRIIATLSVQRIREQYIGIFIYLLKFYSRSAEGL